MIGRAETKPAESSAPDLSRTAMFLVRESAVRKELKLDARQWRSIEAALAEVDGPLWALRDVPPEKSSAPAAQLRAAFQTELDAALEPKQKERLDQLVLQTLSLASLAAPSVADKLELTAEQRERIRAALDETERAANETSTAASKKAQAAGRRRMLDALTEEQRERFIGLLGRPFPVAKVRQAYAQAPELKDLDGWINSPPLALADQRGKVVVLNFWAFGCINCVHNLPWYKGWHEKFAERGVVVLGVHTPETQADRNPNSLRKKVKEDGILYPVAIDTRAQTWAAWANHMWPSTYLIDKRGYVRYWWYGELNWQGAEGEKFMRSKIEELLAEKD
ncbi:MAG TPA: redoxin domain-containing protein [Pirellulales bacterium]|nr:redoxin domain-containing protein [Pirellulales bacterium]